MGVDPFVKLPPPRPPRRRQQVAAVCYRIRKRGIEFLLVQSRGGRWIFPKGGVEPGLTPAQSAALEAFEEAGVHGRMEEMPFARYFRRNPAPSTADPSAQPEVAVTAHLCEVSQLEPPQESNRNPTWFSAEKAKQRLLKDRTPEFGAELARVVDRAFSRIQRLQGARNAPHRVHRDGLQEVRFEAFQEVRFETSEVRRLPYDLKAALVGIGQRSFLRQRRSMPEQILRPVLRLGAGIASPTEQAHNVTAIDSGNERRRARASRPPR